MTNFQSVKILLRAAVSVFTAALLSTQSSHAATATNRPPALVRPSIILIVADDLGYGDLGCYGQTKIKTPNIDKLAAQGMRFTSCYAGGDVGAPSAAALMTGKDTGHSRIRGDGKIPLQADDVTIAEILKQTNYSTGAIGVWGLGEAGSSGVPGKQGFDQWLGFLNPVAAHDHYPESFSRSTGGSETTMSVFENLGRAKVFYSDDYFTMAATNFLKNEHPTWYNHFRPFFLYLPYTLPHANNELGLKTGNGMEVPEDAPYSQEIWPQAEKNKASMVSRLDRYVGTLMEKLKTLNINHNTIVIFTSNNGPHKEGGVNPDFLNSSGPLRGFKRDLYEGGIRVPFIVSWPQRISPGTVSDLPCALWDFLPTAAEIAGKAAPKDIQGISLLPTLAGQAQTNQHKFLYWESHEGRFKQAVRMGDWKGLRIGVDGPLELYNLKTDLGEKVNSATQFPEIVKQIEDYLKTARTADTNWPVQTIAEIQKNDIKDVSPK